MSPLPSLERSLEVGCSQAEAFDLFLARIGAWWPMERFSTSAFRKIPAQLTVHPAVGGEIVEVAEDGTQTLWGEITALEPPRYLAMRFHIPHPDEVVTNRTLVEVTFTPKGSGCTVWLVQSQWEALGRLAKPLHGGYGGGWAIILGAYADACNSPRSET